MRYVDHDPDAARRAAAVCRDCAAEYERIAGEVGAAVTSVAWWGAERERVVAAVGSVCDDLRREAGTLRTSADLLEAAARAAEQRAADLAEQARRAAAADADAAAAASMRVLTDPGWSPVPPAPSPAPPARRTPAAVR